MMTTGVLSYADEITLKGGDVIHGKVIEQNDDGVLLDHEDLGQIKIASDRVASVLIATDEVSQPTEQVEPETGPPAPSRLIEEPEFEKLKAFTVRAKENGWSSSIQATSRITTKNRMEKTRTIN
ncbi:MAG: hypothetical protein ACYSSK_01425 [Planctomycetota bacterium]